MKTKSWIVAALVVAASAAFPAAAQTPKEVQGYIAGGYTSPLGRASDYFTGGWNLSGGAIFRPAPDRPFGVRFDLGYNDMGVNSGTLNKANASGLRVDSGRMTVGSLTADVLWEFGHPGRVGGYLGFGIGGYRRYAELTNAVLTYGYVCDPWWGWCYPGAVPGEVIQANDTLTKFGYNASLGMTFGVGQGQLYLEARYHYMISDPATEFLPFVIGYRF